MLVPAGSRTPQAPRSGAWGSQNAQHFGGTAHPWIAAGTSMVKWEIWRESPLFSQLRRAKIRSKDVQTSRSAPKLSITYSGREIENPRARGAGARLGPV